MDTGPQASFSALSVAHTKPHSSYKSLFGLLQHWTMTHYVSMFLLILLATYSILMLYNEPPQTSVPNNKHLLLMHLRSAAR